MYLNQIWIRIFLDIYNIQIVRTHFQSELFRGRYKLVGYGPNLKILDT